MPSREAGGLPFCCLGTNTQEKAATWPLGSPHLCRLTPDNYHDLHVRGLLLRVTDKGVKSFYLRRKMHGQSERIFIGQFSGTTIKMARSRAFELQITIARGEDPQDTRQLHGYGQPEPLYDRQSIRSQISELDANLFPFYV